MFQFASNPTFVSLNWDDAKHQLTLRHPLWTYDVWLEQDVPRTCVQQFREVMDWFAKLSTVRPGVPAGPRIELNREMAARGGLPREIQVLRELKPETRQHLKSTHAYTFELEVSDLTRIAEIEKAIQLSQPWSLLEHLRYRADNGADKSNK